MVTHILAALGESKTDHRWIDFGKNWTGIKRMSVPSSHYSKLRVMSSRYAICSDLETRTDRIMIQTKRPANNRNVPQGSVGEVSFAIDQL